MCEAKTDCRFCAGVTLRSKGAGLDLDGDVASLVYSPQKSGYLMWTVSNLYEVSRHRNCH